jgi:hypothetical protein
MKRFVPGTLIALLLAATGAADAQENEGQSPEDRQKQQKEEKAALDAQGLAAMGLAALAPQCFTSGSGATFLKVCITERGNVSHFEAPAGQVHLQTREGYVVCSSFFEELGVHGFDAGSAQEGWAAATVSQPNGLGKLPLIITRNSLDGLVRLKQTFNVIPGEREVFVTMEVKNRSAVTTLPDVELDRYFDGDVNNQRLNTYRSTNQSVSGLPQLLGSPLHGLMLTQAPSNAAISPSVGQIQTFAEWDPNGTSFQGARFCRGSSGVFDNEDLVGRFITSFGNIAPGKTKSVTYRYHGI